MAVYSYDVTIPFTQDPAPTNSAIPRTSLLRAAKMFRAIAGGDYPGASTVVAKDEAVAASGTATCASVALNDTVTVGGVTFTAKTAGPTGDQWLVGVSDTADAAALAAAWNASGTAATAGVVASSSGAVVTFTAKDAGKTGNLVTLASSNGTRLAVSGSRLASGTATYTTLSF